MVVDRADLTRLGETLQATGEIGPDAMERNVTAIAEMVAEAAREGASAVAAVGTMALRTARNSKQFIDKVRERCGLAIEVIPGEEESRLSYLAVKSGIGSPDGSMVIFDTGGGSTEFVFGKGTAVLDRFSLNVGALRFTETFGLGDIVTPERLQEAIQAIGKDLARLDAAASPDALVGMGGTVTNIAGVRHRLAKYDPDIVQGSSIDAGRSTVRSSSTRSRSVEDRRQDHRAPTEAGGRHPCRSLHRQHDHGEAPQGRSSP